MPFKKGESGNPNGRPKGSKNKQTSDREEIMSEVLHREVRKTVVASAAKRAIEGNDRTLKVLLEYMWGKPPAGAALSEEAAQDGLSVLFQM